MAVIFKKYASTVQNWNKKQEKRGDNLLFWRSQSYVDRDLQEKVFNLFSHQRAARGFSSFSKSGPSCEKLAHLYCRGCFSTKG